MAAVGVVLQSSQPAITTLTDVYTVPGTFGTPPHTTKSRIVAVLATNIGAAATVRIAVSPLGAVIANTHYFHYDNPLAVGESKTYALELSLSGTDVVRCYSSTGNVVFHVVGQEGPE